MAASLTTGAGVALLIVIVLCMSAMFVGSVFGIFFSGDPNPRTGQSIHTVIAGIDAEYTAQIDSIIAAYDYDALDISGARAWWKNVLAVYTVRTVSDPHNPMDVAAMNDEKAAILRSVFWDINTISHWVERIRHAAEGRYGWLHVG